MNVLPLITLAIIYRPTVGALIVEVEWLDDRIEGRWLYNWGLLVVNVAGQFIHLNRISLVVNLGCQQYRQAVT